MRGRNVVGELKRTQLTPALGRLTGASPAIVSITMRLNALKKGANLAFFPLNEKVAKNYPQTLFVDCLGIPGG